jgi:hypothetical protein
VSGTAYSKEGSLHGGMGVDWGDWDDDGDLDLFVGTFQGETKCLYRSENNGAYFVEQGDEVGLTPARPLVTFGAKFLDFDNDGYLDLLMANGHVQDNIDAIDPTASYRQPTLLFRNEKGRHFAPVSARMDARAQVPIVGRGVAVGHPGQLPADAGVRREHLQVGQRRGQGRARQVSLGAEGRDQEPDQGEAEQIQAKNFNHATHDLFEHIARGEFPEWELLVQIMEDGEHPELDFDPLDDTKLWPQDQFPWLPVGRMVLNRNPENYFAEVEQAAFGTGVLVDGLDFSDDKMLQGRTLSYSDTQRYRVGPNYLQLPINAPKKHVATNQRDGQMTYRVDLAPGQNPHVNYEPSSWAAWSSRSRRARTTPRSFRANSSASRWTAAMTSNRPASATGRTRIGSATT